MTTSKRDAARRHDGAYDLQGRLARGPAEPEASAPALAPVSNRARETQAALERAGEEVAIEDLMRHFSGGLPPLPPPPGLGGDPEDQAAAAGPIDPEDDPEVAAALARITAAATTRRPPALPAPPDPLFPVRRR